MKCKKYAIKRHKPRQETTDLFYQLKRNYPSNHTIILMVIKAD